MATSIVDYDSLITQVAAWLNRTDLNAQIPEFIDMVERDVNRRLMDQDMEQRSYTTMIAGTKKYALPTGCLSLKHIQVESGTQIYPLDYRTPQALATLNDRAANGIPQWYTLAGNEIEVSPPPDAAYALRVVFIKQVPSLDATTTTNWLIEDHPDIYLHGAVKEAWYFVRNLQEAQRHEGEYEKGIESLRVQDWNSAASGSALEMVAG